MQTTADGPDTPCLITRRVACNAKEGGSNAPSLRTPRRPAQMRTCDEKGSADGECLATHQVRSKT
eukprot:5540755-Pleurochrysis_carterae.AAC.1